MDKLKFFCPLIKGECKKDKCMWFVSGIKHCAINVIAQCGDSIEDSITLIKEYGIHK